MEQNFEVLKTLVLLDERLKALEDRVNEFMPEIKTKIENASEEIQELKLEIQPIVAEYKSDSEEIKRLIMEIQPIAIKHNTNLRVILTVAVTIIAGTLIYMAYNFVWEAL